MGARIAQFGAGRMGAPIATALRSAGFDIVVWDPSPTALGSISALDVPVASSAIEAATSSDILLTVLPGAAEVEDAVAPLVSHLAPGALWLDLTSGDPRVTERLAATAAEFGTETVGAAMVGGPGAARSRSIAFLVGGSPPAIARARPVLEVLGRVDEVGESAGSGQLAKLLGNLLWFGQVVAVTEALLLGKAMGVPVRTLRGTLADGPGASAFIHDYLDRLIDGDDLADFSLARCVEELAVLESIARDAALPFALSSLVTETHREALARFGDVDGELLAARLLEARAGFRVD